jgi:hypothetical protein
MPTNDKPQAAEADPPVAPAAARRTPPQKKQLTRAQLEAIRQKLQKKFH